MRTTLVPVLLAAVLTACGPDAQELPPGCDPEIGQKFDVEGQAHVPDGTTVEYRNNPPSSGDHASPLPYGKYRTEQPRERWVHSLEHGAIVLLYNCPAGCDDVRDALEAIHDRTDIDETGRRRVIVTPDSRMPHRIAAVAWQWVLALDTVDEQQISCFIAAHKGKAPENL
ncbi:MAG: DUF3105 domain-containing protein [Myxococcales bacterium]